jgi:predicted  nucleic acid-binding Zn-ribbon protein
MKNKDISNYREENNDLDSRLQQKTTELRTLKTQLQVVQSRYEEVLQELDNQQSGTMRKAEQVTRDVQDNFEKQLAEIRMENIQLRETIREF